jgi:hypothetical protein
VEVFTGQIWICIQKSQLESLLETLYRDILADFKRLGVPLLSTDCVVMDRPSAGRFEGTTTTTTITTTTTTTTKITTSATFVLIKLMPGIGTFNSHLWGAENPPSSRLSPADTARTCSSTEAKFSVVVAVSGGGHCRITDVGRSKVLGADR